jgi:hypothetical protein
VLLGWEVRVLDDFGWRVLTCSFHAFAFAMTFTTAHDAWRRCFDDALVVLVVAHLARETRVDHHHFAAEWNRWGAR